MALLSSVDMRWFSFVFCVLICVRWPVIVSKPLMLVLDSWFQRRQVGEQPRMYTLGCPRS